MWNQYAKIYTFHKKYIQHHLHFQNNLIYQWLLVVLSYHLNNLTGGDRGFWVQGRDNYVYTFLRRYSKQPYDEYQRYYHPSAKCSIQERVFKFSLKNTDDWCVKYFSPITNFSDYTWFMKNMKDHPLCLTGWMDIWWLPKCTYSLDCLKYNNFYQPWFDSMDVP